MEIKKCPFCGSKAEYTEHGEYDDGHYTSGVINCTNRKCGCSTPRIPIDGYYGTKTTKKDVYKIWNSRI